MAELPELLKRRAILKSSLTRFTTFFENHKSNIAHAKQISIRKEVLNKTFNDFNDIQTSIELLKDDEKAYRESFETDYYKVIADVSSYLESHTLTSSSTSVNSSQGIAESVIAKLPPINLPSFEGNYIDWVNFKNTFDSMIHERNDLTNIQKFHYLKSSVKGEAQKLIVHLAITQDNYITAYNLLKSRFENRRIIVQQHVNTLINLPQVTKGSPASLRQLLDGLSTNLSILQNLDIPVQSWDIILIQLMLSKLDYHSRREWETSCKTTNIPTLKEFSDILTNHCLTLEALSDSHKGKSSIIEKPKQSQKSFVSVKNETTTKKCLYCNKSNHYLYQCKEFLSLAVSNRIDQINKRKLCKNCLRTNHDSDSCKGGCCRVCGSNTHNTLLHKDTSEQLDEINNDVNVLNSSTTLPINVILSTALVQVQDKAGNFTQLRALLDSGSQSNFITESALKSLNLPSYNTNITLSGVNNSHSKVNKGTTLIFKSNFNKFQASVKCLVLPKITQNIPASPLVYDTFKIPSNIKLADPTFNKPGPIDLLLGNELFWKVLCVGKVQLGPAKRLIAQNTQLGWILGGCWDSNKENTKTICTFSSKNLEKQMVKFWQIEEIDHKPILSREHERCEKQFLECHKRLANGKFQVPLMFKSESPNIGLSFDQALKRFQSLERKLSRDLSLKGAYTEFINEYVDLGHMEVVPSKDIDVLNNKHFYLPHHAVFKIDSLTTKLRVVFDGSVKSSNNLSLNDNLMGGPTLQKDLFHILVNFRIHRIVLCSDITKMYRQIFIDPAHRDFLRILWRNHPDDPLQVFRLKTVTYGTTCAPYQAIRCLMQLALENEKTYPLACPVIQNSFYVDDLLHSVDKKETAIELRDQLIKCLSLGGFELRKWVSNESDVLPPNESQSEFLNLDKEINKTLGLFWNNKQDTLHYKYEPDTEVSTITKRTILSTISKLFDPLGLIGPTKAKILLQKLWLLKIDWNESVPENIKILWLQFVEELPSLHDISISRFVLGKQKIKRTELCFCDASQAAYGAVLYIKFIDQEQNCHVNILCAKSRVAPIKTISSPKLELSAAMLLAKLFNKVYPIISHKIDDHYFWTDSTIVLSWLSGEPTQWKVFVANRVSEIQSQTDSDRWYHVKGEENPADIISRGLLPSQLRNSKLWFHGPRWLHSHPDTWRCNHISRNAM
jgi:hypothetical protein